jgi:hypothetical protein
MTDGEPTGVRLPCHNTFVYKEGMTFKFEHRSSVLDNMIKIFRELTGMKAICFFLCENKYTLNAWTYGSSNHSESNQLAEEASKRYAKEGWVSAMKNSHKYDEKFIIRAQNAVEDADLDDVLSTKTAQNAVEDADLDDVLSTKTTSVSIRNGFIKAMSQTKTSRTMLNRFIELISKE